MSLACVVESPERAGSGRHAKHEASLDSSEERKGSTCGLGESDGELVGEGVGLSLGVGEERHVVGKVLLVVFSEVVGDGVRVGESGSGKVGLRGAMPGRLSNARGGGAGRSMRDRWGTKRMGPLRNGRSTARSVTPVPVAHNPLWNHRTMSTTTDSDANGTLPHSFPLGREEVGGVTGALGAIVGVEAAGSGMPGGRARMAASRGPAARAELHP